MTLDELETSARLHLDLYGELTMPIGTQTILDLIAKLRAAEAVAEPARVWANWLHPQNLVDAIAAYDALGEWWERRR